MVGAIAEQIQGAAVDVVRAMQGISSLQGKWEKEVS